MKHISVKNILFALFGLLFSVSAIANSNDSTQTISIISRATPDQIMLKWAVDSPQLWRKANKYGFYLLRTTLVRNGTPLTNEEIKPLNDGNPIKPAPPEYWESAMEENDNAAIMAQALFGESFEVESENPDEISALINLIQEEEQRYTYALIVTDRDFEIAQKAGVAFVDPDVNPNEMYLYQVAVAASPELVTPDTAFVYTGLSDYTELPQIINVIPEFQEKRVILSWDDRLYRTTYSSYNIERSLNGADFKPINESPVMPLNPSTSLVMYADTITNGVDYYYRVRGISFFGEAGPYSEIVSGKANKKLDHTPRFTGYEFLGASSVKLKWEFNQEAVPLTDHFEIACAENHSGNYKVIKQSIDAGEAQATIDNLWYASNYLVITAFGKNGEQKRSTPYLVQVVDSFPPAPPVMLSGKMDSIGVVSLNWNANTETDIWGYKVLRGQRLKEEFSVLTPSPIPNNNFSDTLPVKFLNEKIYYNIVAVDKRNNHSGYSEMLIVERPDLIPPSAPVFTAFKTKPDSVLLSWTKSSSTDVIAHELYRREYAKGSPGGWAVIYTADTLAPGSFVDTEVKGKTKYEFAIVAVDDAGLRSEKENNIVVTTPAGVDTDILNNFKALVDRSKNSITLSWDSQPKAIKTIWLYKAENDKPLTLYKKFSGDVHSYLDEKISLNSHYKYLIKAISVSGQPSAALEKGISY